MCITHIHECHVTKGVINEWCVFINQGLNVSTCDESFIHSYSFKQIIILYYL